MKINFLKNKFNYVKAKSLLTLSGAIVLIAGTSFYISSVEGDGNKSFKTATKTESSNEISQDSSSVDIPIRDDVSNMELPILMYHHTRDYNNPDDNIGTNLSVSLMKFRQELDLINSLGYETTTFSGLKSSMKKPIILTFDDGYQNFYDNAYPELKKRGMTAVSFIIVNDVGKSGYMNENEIKEINNYGIEIGSHTLSHPDLSESTTTKQNTEIVDSKVKLEQILGSKIITFCYPSGKYSDETLKIVTNANYRYAVTTMSGIAKLVNPTELNRYRVNSDTNISGYIK